LGGLVQMQGNTQMESALRHAYTQMFKDDIANGLERDRVRF
jgi:hypothetical protein